TFGGETLSLAAAYAALNKLQKEPVIEKLFQTGELLMTQLKDLINEYDLGEIFDVTGYPVWSFLTITAANQFDFWSIKTLLEQEMFANGIFMIGTHNISYAHSKDDITSLMLSYRSFFQ